mmetsp:Transcript_29276/g.97287  ORF Transcript_29276/g.97287 Transcript_29276/m.97287 type:complete len:298 (+) Transcript_29276:1525-2418(+)
MPINETRGERDAGKREGGGVVGSRGTVLPKQAIGDRGSGSVRGVNAVSKVSPPCEVNIKDVLPDRIFPSGDVRASCKSSGNSSPSAAAMAAAATAAIMAPLGDTPTARGVGGVAAFGPKSVREPSTCESLGFRSGGVPTMTMGLVVFGLFRCASSILSHRNCSTSSTKLFRSAFAFASADASSQACATVLRCISCSLNSTSKLRVLLSRWRCCSNSSLSVRFSFWNNSLRICPTSSLNSDISAMDCCASLARRRTRRVSASCPSRVNSASRACSSASTFASLRAASVCSTCSASRAS